MLNLFPIYFIKPTYGNMLYRLCKMFWYILFNIALLSHIYPYLEAFLCFWGRSDWISCFSRKETVKLFLWWDQGKCYCWSLFMAKLLTYSKKTFKIFVWRKCLLSRPGAKRCAIVINQSFYYFLVSGMKIDAHQNKGNAKIFCVFSFLFFALCMKHVT